MPVGPDDLGPWFRGRKRLLVAKGKKCEEFDLSKLKPDERAAKVLGPSGKLRAPTLLLGDTVVVGFHDDAYRELFG